VTFRLLPIRSALKQFLRWWLQELRSLVHDAAVKIAPTWSRSVTIFIDKGCLKVLDDAATSDNSILESSYDQTSGMLPVTFTVQLSEALKDCRRAHILVSSDKAFIQQVRLPAAALPHLATALSLQFSKLLPLNSDRLLTAFELVTSDANFGVIDLAALKRAEIEPLVNAISSAGPRVSTIRLADEPKANPRFRFELASGSVQQSRLRRIDRLLLGAAAGLGIACTAVAATQSYRAERSLLSAEAHIRAAASSALDRRQAVLSKLEPLSALSELESRPGVSVLLAEVTSIVPKDTWVTTLEVKDRRLRLVGVSPDSAALVRLLSESSFLNDVELRSSMSTGVGTGKERFEMSAEIKGGAP
jgi:general secretion pathway protein L